MIEQDASEEQHDCRYEYHAGQNAKHSSGQKDKQSAHSIDQPDNNNDRYR